MRFEELPVWRIQHGSGGRGKEFPWVSLVDVDFDHKCPVSFEDKQGSRGRVTAVSRAL